MLETEQKGYHNCAVSSSGTMMHSSKGDKWVQHYTHNTDAPQSLQHISRYELCNLLTQVQSCNSHCHHVHDLRGTYASSSTNSLNALIAILCDHSTWQVLLPVMVSLAKRVLYRCQHTYLYCSSTQHLPSPQKARLLKPAIFFAFSWAKLAFCKCALRERANVRGDAQ